MLFIFDMGGVMTDAVPIIRRMADRLDITETEFCRFASFIPLPDGSASVPAEGDTASANPYLSGALAALERGEISEKEFWNGFEKVSGISADAEYWRLYFRPKRKRKMYDIVSKLRQGHRVTCGTNTIPCHYCVHLERGDYACFDKVYASHLMGTNKPDPSFWHLILEAEETKAENAAFFDDNENNIAAAKKAGLHNSFLFTDEEDIERILKNIGYDVG